MLIRWVGGNVVVEGGDKFIFGDGEPWLREEMVYGGRCGGGEVRMGEEETRVRAEIACDERG